MSSKRRSSYKQHPSTEAAPTNSYETQSEVAQEAAYIASPAAPMNSDRDYERIGDILRRVREHRGEKIIDIANYLCIRPNYLYALEKSRYDELPADAYVIGFLRSYASYLGLESKGAIDQYRREMAGQRRKPQLSMPQPMPEGRAPTVTVLIGAAVAALLIYGIWYGLSSPSREAQDPSVTLPVTQEETNASQSTAGEIVTEENVSSPTAATPMPEGTPAASDGILLTVPETAVPAKPVLSNEKAGISAEKALLGTLAPAGEKTKEEKKETAPAPTATVPGQTTAAPPAAQPGLSMPAAATPAPAAKTNEQPKLPAETKPQTQVQPTTLPASTKNSTVTVTADRPSWILVTDSKGNTVFDQTLKPGESYMVPSQKGLKLTTGNAEGLTFEMNGAKLPKLNTGSNMVVRAMPLDTDLLERRLNGRIPPSSSTEAPIRLQ